MHSLGNCKPKERLVSRIWQVICLRLDNYSAKFSQKLDGSMNENSFVLQQILFCVNSLPSQLVTILQAEFCQADF